jgi:aminoglycoside phosphotransferase (APT) family kinase protein
VTAAEERVATPPDPALMAWALHALHPSPGDHGVSYVGLREGGSPWLIELDGARAAVLKIVPAAARASLATELAALELAAAHGLPVPRVLAADVDGSVAPGSLAVVTAVVPGTSRQGTGSQTPERFRRLGALAAAIHRVPAPVATAELPVREHPIPGVDFAALRRAAERRPLLVAAEESLADAPPPERAPVFVHGDLWQGNTLWDGGVATGVVDWDCAGVGAAGIDLGSLRCDAWMGAGREAAAGVLAGYEEAAGRPADDLAYWDVVAALSTPPTIDWFVTAIQDQGRYDLDQPTLLTRRDAFLRDALHRLG